MQATKNSKLHNQSLIIIIIILILLGVNSYLFILKNDFISPNQNENQNLNFFDLSALFNQNSTYSAALLSGAKDLIPYLEVFHAFKQKKGRALFSLILKKRPTIPNFRHL